MELSARLLGREFFGRTAQEMNKLLLAQGFLEGGPGAYQLTPLGEQFARWVDRDNGYGGVAAREWSYRLWDEKVVDALKASMKANPNGVAPPAVPEVVVSTVKAGVDAVRNGRGASEHLLGRNGWVAAAVVVAGLGVASPPARRAWEEKIKPAASRFRARLAGSESATTAHDADEGDAGSPVDGSPT